MNLKIIKTIAVIGIILCAGWVVYTAVGDDILNDVTAPEGAISVSEWHDSRSAFEDGEIVKIYGKVTLVEISDTIKIARIKDVYGSSGEALDIRMVFSDSITVGDNLLVTIKEIRDGYTYDFDIISYFKV